MPLTFGETVRQAMSTRAKRPDVSIRRAAIVAVCAIGVAICVLAPPDSPVGRLVQHVVKQNKTLDSVLKNTKLLFTYAGLVVPGELAARLTSFMSLLCSHSTNWLKYPNVNLVVIGLEGGLLLRAAKLTWRVLRKALMEYSFTERENRLYRVHFEKHGLSRREFRELLDAGAEWQCWDPSERRNSGWAKLAGALTLEGKPPRGFVLLTEGSCVVRSGGVQVAELGPGALVGESSFALRMFDNLKEEGAGPASATVLPVGRIEYVIWPSKQLAQHMAKSSYAKACLLTIIAAAQAKKLHDTTASVRSSAMELAELQEFAAHSQQQSIRTPDEDQASTA